MTWASTSAKRSGMFIRVRSSAIRVGTIRLDEWRTVPARFREQPRVEFTMSTNDRASEQVALDLHDLYENAPCGYHSVGPDGTILRINRTELNWLGFTAQELVGKRRLAELVTARFRDEYRRVIQTLISGRHALGSASDVAEIEIELVRADGSVFA